MGSTGMRGWFVPTDFRSLRRRRAGKSAGGTGTSHFAGSLNIRSGRSNGWPPRLLTSSCAADRPSASWTAPRCPRTWPTAAAALGYDALALADRDGLYGAPRFFRAARKSGTLRPLVGADVTLAPSAEEPGGPPRRRCCCWCEDRAGYRNLCRLLTAMKAGAAQGRRRGQLRPAGRTRRRPDRAGGRRAARRSAAPARHLRRASDLYVELQRHLDDAEAHRNRRAVAAAEALGIPVVATNDVRYAEPRLRRAHDVLTCARLKTTVDAVGRQLLRNAERYLKPPAVMAALFRDRPDAVRATRAIAERCAFTLADLGYSLPRLPGGAGRDRAELPGGHHLDGRARALPPAAPTRPAASSSTSCSIIGTLGLAGYFLVVWDIVEYARRRGILVQGRGSAANSALCYALGITAVDPVRMELLFERFLSEERVKSATDAADRMPDIDLDLPSGDRREEVIQHVYRKYGERGAGMTANVITYRPRMAVRDTGRALGFSEEQLNKISKHLPYWIVDGREAAVGLHRRRRLPRHRAAHPPAGRGGHPAAEPAPPPGPALGRHGDLRRAPGRGGAAGAGSHARAGWWSSGTRTTAPTWASSRSTCWGWACWRCWRTRCRSSASTRGSTSTTPTCRPTIPRSTACCGRRTRSACSRSSRGRRWPPCRACSPSASTIWWSRWRSSGPGPSWARW